MGQKGFHDCLLQIAFLQRGRVLTFPLAVIQPADTPPNDPFSTGCPSTSPIRSSALPTNQKISQRVFGTVFSHLGFRTDLLGFRFSGAPRQFLLHPPEGIRVNNGGMIMFDIVHRSFAVVLPHLLADTINGVGLIENGVPLIFLI